MNEEKSFTLAELALLTNCSLFGNPTQVIHSVSDLENALPEDATFLSNPRYAHLIKNSQAGVIFVDHQTVRLENQNYLVSDEPSNGFQKLIDLLHSPQTTGFSGIHPSAVIHPTARLKENVQIGPGAVIDEGVIVGENSQVGPGCYIGPYTSIGCNCLIHPRVVIRENCRIGKRVILQPGCVIGSCGFGYFTDKRGNHLKLNQVGNVVIEDDVEIGANTTIDRARFKSTVIGSGTKIDNLVQIAHGVKIGKNCLVVAQTGIAGSTTLGNFVVLAGQVAVAGHLRLADQVIVAAKSGVTKSLKAGKYAGFPAVPLTDHHRNQVFLKNIEKYLFKR
ncbi:MAG: UDP-3-O-(3-hydroxymyristoyl)glucosamine N-acyltransferase [Parachlamydia sp.]|jgi:UDP-3-O-[3-hydroxymyristoyl] glucosamine N-acyltransferase|nr:UDP-3-O-(3-hydroxymyristoyl)glucosamine N-acyltransferase [Parachlamydia sp.]